MARVRTPHAIARSGDERINWVTSIPFLALHLLPFVAIWTGVGVRAAVLFVVLYFGRVFFITAGYHRYFSHRSYRLNRPMQFLMAFGGTTAAQKGPIWWAAHHRNHHRFSDTDKDVHSPLKGFWWSHVGWILCDKYNDADLDRVKDLTRYPEIRFLERFDWIGPWTVGVAAFWIGGPSGLFFGFFGSQVLVWHGTFMINSLAHVFGRRRYVTTDTSRNSFLLAVVTMGEGWHNNHHYYQVSARQGFFWWEWDPTFYVLRALSWVGLVKDLKVPSAEVRAGQRVRAGHFDVGMFGAYSAKARAALAAAGDHAADFAGARRRALEQLAASTRETADGLARLLEVPTPATVPATGVRPRRRR
ncbi:MAG: acyl-CoA desaturase [Acidimicrobiia bacterium]